MALLRSDSDFPTPHATSSRVPTRSTGHRAPSTSVPAPFVRVHTYYALRLHVEFVVMLMVFTQTTAAGKAVSSAASSLDTASRE